MTSRSRRGMWGGLRLSVWRCCCRRRWFLCGLCGGGGDLLRCRRSLGFGARKSRDRGRRCALPAACLGDVARDGELFLFGFAVGGGGVYAPGFFEESCDGFGGGDACHHGARGAFAGVDLSAREV